MKILINKNNALVIIDNKKYKFNINNDEKQILLSDDEKAIVDLCESKSAKKDNNYISEKEILKSKILSLRDSQSVIWKEISRVSIPVDFVRKILVAEKYNDTKRIEKYKNFWTLVSINPDANVRNNMFWFIRKWGMSISKAGFIIAYRNVDIVKKSDYDIKDVIDLYYKAKYIDNVNPNTIDYKGNTLENVFQSVIFGDMGDVYTDNHTHTFTIRLGKIVTIPREQCDSNQKKSCSQGLHVGAKGWLKQNYCGNVGLKVLVNPADVVAVPTIDNYGKMRCCSYMPVGVISFDSIGNVIDTPVSIEDEIKYISEAKQINNEDVNNYLVVRHEKPLEERFKNILRTLNNENN